MSDFRYCWHVTTAEGITALIDIRSKHELPGTLSMTALLGGLVLESWPIIRDYHAEHSAHRLIKSCECGFICDINGDGLSRMYYHLSECEIHLQSDNHKEGCWWSRLS